MQINDFIYHEKYGIGKITSLDGRFITVDFSGTPKQFLKSDGSKFLKPAIQNQFVVVSGELISYVGSSQKIVLPHQVHAIGAKAFANAKFLYSIDLGCHVSRIDSRAFENCANLEKVMGTHGLSVIESGAFRNCSKLTYMPLPESLQKIGTAAFQHCYSLKEIHISQRIHEILPESFIYCSSLESVTGLSGVRTIGENAFYACSALQSIAVPSNVIGIADDAFGQVHECFTIYGETNSLAQAFAKKEGIPFKLLSEKDVPPITKLVITPIQQNKKEDAFPKPSYKIQKSAVVAEPPAVVVPQDFSIAELPATPEVKQEISKKTAQTAPTVVTMKAKPRRHTSKGTKLAAACLGVLIVLGAVLGLQHDRIENIADMARFGEIRTDEGIYSGDLDLGVIQGTGTMKYNDSAQYTGEWYQGVKNGLGTLSYANGDVYSGKFDAGIRSGSGSYEWSDGTQYEGNWIDNQISGNGILRYADGSTYDGEFAQGVRAGNGSYTWPDGAVYTGSWKDDMPNGDGTLTTQSDAVYSGEFTDGQLTDGTYSYQSQDYTFTLHTEPQSSPTFSVRYTDGTEIDGTALDDGYSCSVHYANGDTYTGLIVSGMRNGDGTYTWSSG